MKGKLEGFTILGKGSFGSVYKVVSKIDGLPYVLKRIDLKSLKPKSRPEQEVQIMRQLEHPNVIRFYDSYLDNGELCIVMEYAERGDLHHYLRRHREKGTHLSEGEIMRLGREVTEGLRYLHSKGIVHRDIKALNIFLDRSGQAKIGDLGISKLMEDDLLLTRIGTPVYLAPEQIKHQQYDYKVDIWALGCLLYQCATLDLPFKSKNLIMLGYQIINKTPKYLDSYSDKLNLIVKRLLTKNPKLRPSAQECLAFFKEQRRVTSAVPAYRLNKQTCDSDSPHFQELQKCAVQQKPVIKIQKVQIKQPQVQLKRVRERQSRPIINLLNNNLASPSYQSFFRSKEKPQQQLKLDSKQLLKQLRAKESKAKGGLQLISLRSIEIKDSGFDRLNEQTYRGKLQKQTRLQSPRRIQPSKQKLLGDKLRIRPTSAVVGHENNYSHITLHELLRCKDQIKPTTLGSAPLPLPFPPAPAQCQEEPCLPPQKASQVNFRREPKVITKPSFVSFSYKAK